MIAPQARQAPLLLRQQALRHQRRRNRRVWSSPRTRFARFSRASTSGKSTRSLRQMPWTFPAARPTALFTRALSRTCPIPPRFPSWGRLILMARQVATLNRAAGSAVSIVRAKPVYSVLRITTRLFLFVMRILFPVMRMRRRVIMQTFTAGGNLTFRIWETIWKE